MVDECSSVSININKNINNDEEPLFVIKTQAIINEKVIQKKMKIFRSYYDKHVINRIIDACNNETSLNIIGEKAQIIYYSSVNLVCFQLVDNKKKFLFVPAEQCMGILVSMLHTLNRLH